MGTIAGWVLLMVVGASGRPVDPTHEAVCGLKGLFTTERAYFNEKDRYDPSPERLGFLPLPCADGTRPSTSGGASVGGCRFVFTVTEAGTALESLRAEAHGVGAGVEGLRFVVDDQGRITRADTRALVAEPDCEAWRREADPLWRYHDIIMEHDCVSGPYDAKHPCSGALAELASLARAGVGVAQREYAAHPTARELAPLEAPTPAMSLCGLLATAEQRARAAETLERRGELVAAVLEPRCHAEGLRVALPRVLRRFGAVCPGANCLELLTLARRAQVPGLENHLRTHASTLAEAILQQPPDKRGERLSGAVGLSSPHPSALAEALRGKWPGLQRLGKLPAEPVMLALLDRARLAHPELSPRLELLRETMGLGTASPAAFRAWTTTAPCEELNDAHLLELSPTRLRSIAETQARCRGGTVRILQRYSAKLPPRQLMEVLEPLTDEQVGWMISELGLDEPERAGALVDWAVDRQPRLIEAIRATVPVVRKLLSPRNVERLGGRDAVLDMLLRRRGGWQGTMEEEALELVFREALRGTPPPDRVRHLATYLLPPAEMSRLLSGALHSREARVRAAAAAGLAELVGRTIPQEAARACLAEVRVGFQCVEAIAQRMGPPPPGKRYGPFMGCGAGAPRRSPLPPQPLEDYCVRLEKEARSCQNACGGLLPVEEELARLETAARESLTYPNSLRACAYGGP